MTTYAEAENILASDEELELAFKVGGRNSSESVDWGFRFTSVDPDVFEKSFTGVGVIGSNGIVEAIDVGYSRRMSLQQVIDTFGTPEKLVAYQTGGPELMYFQAVLYYPQQGVVFDAVLRIQRNMALSPSDIVYGGVYFSPRSMEDMLDARRVPVRGTGLHEYFIDWPGFGPLEIPPELSTGRH